MVEIIRAELFTRKFFVYTGSPLCQSRQVRGQGIPGGKTGKRRKNEEWEGQAENGRHYWSQKGQFCEFAVLLKIQSFKFSHVGADAKFCVREKENTSTRTPASVHRPSYGVSPFEQWLQRLRFFNVVEQSRNLFSQLLTKLFHKGKELLLYLGEETITTEWYLTLKLRKQICQKNSYFQLLQILPKCCSGCCGAALFANVPFQEVLLSCLRIFV